MLIPLKGNRSSIDLYQARHSKGAVLPGGVCFFLHIRTDLIVHLKLTPQKRMQRQEGRI